MSVISKLKRTAGEYFLRSEAAGISRKRTVSNLETAKSVALLFDAENPENYELVKKYIKYLREGKKRVHAIGFFNTKHLPQTEYAKLDYDFFSRKELNWWGKPTVRFIDNFVNEEFDILINFSLDDSFPLKYIAALSKAKMKIGKHDEGEEQLYDIFIQQPEGKSFKFFMRQIDHYLGIINKSTDENI